MKLKLILASSIITLVVIAIVPIPIGFWQTGGITKDNMESYTNGIVLDGLNGGERWKAAYYDKPNAFGVWSHDTIESYTDGVELDGLNGLYGFSSSYADRIGNLGIRSRDSFTSYTDGVSVDGLNGGELSWNTAYSDR